MLKVTLSILLFFSTNTFASSYSVYTLLNSSVQAVFPNTPQEIDVSVIPMAKQLNLRAFQSFDRSVPAVYRFRARNFGQEKEIGAYNNKIKTMMDAFFKDTFIYSGGTVSSFYSNFDRKQSLYTAELAGTIDLGDGVIGYKNMMFLIHKKRVYEWNVTYLNKKLKSQLFDRYKKLFRVIP